MAGRLSDGTLVDIKPIDTRLIDDATRCTLLKVHNVVVTYKGGHPVRLHGARTGRCHLEGHQPKPRGGVFSSSRSVQVSDVELRQRLVVELLSVAVNHLDVNQQVALAVATKIATVIGDGDDKK